MKKLRSRDILTAVAVVIPLAAAAACRRAAINTDGFISLAFGLIRAAVYYSMIGAWALSVRRRILQKSGRNCLLMIAALLILWLTERTVKFMFIGESETAARYLWYSYYIPMLLIPIFGIMAAVCMGKSEGYRPQARLKLLFIPALVNIAAVFTNDLHQLVFAFPYGVANGNDNYTYGILYYLTAGQICVGTLVFFLLLYRNSRLPDKHKRILLPFLPAVAGIVYSALYVAGFDFIRYYLGDLAVVVSVLMIATCECCIQVGLIPSNSHYKDLFYASSLGTRITDNDYNVILNSEKSLFFTPEIMRKTESAPVILDGGIRVFGACIRAGHVIWYEDVSELTSVMKKLADNKTVIESSNMLFEKLCRTRQNIQRLQEKNRLYDSVQRQTAQKAALSAELLEKLKSTDNEDEKRRLLGKLVVIGAYLKRRSNLIFIAEQNSVVEERDLGLCFEESFDNLSLCNIECAYYINIGQSIPAEAAMELYDFYESVAEAAIDSLRSFLLRIFIRSGGIFACADVDCDADLNVFAGDRTEISYTDGIATVTLRIGEKAGDNNEQTFQKSRLTS